MWVALDRDVSSLFKKIKKFEKPIDIFRDSVIIAPVLAGHELKKFS